jgi:hypothetical protein
MLDFPSVSINKTAATPYVCCTMYGAALLCSWISPHDMFVPVPANSLMHSAWHVTTYVHIRFWISKYKYKASVSCNIEYRCHNLPAYWHTLHFMVLNEDGCVHCTKAHFV